MTELTIKFGDEDVVYDIILENESLQDIMQHISDQIYVIQLETPIHKMIYNEEFDDVKMRLRATFHIMYNDIQVQLYRELLEKFQKELDNTNQS